MAMAQQRRDVITVSVRTKQTGMSINIYADDLDILDSNNKSCWEYGTNTYGESFARLLSDIRVDVKCELPVERLTQGKTYLVYFDLTVDAAAAGFNNTFFEFTDQNGVVNTIQVIKLEGDGLFRIAKFTMSAGSSPNVTARLYDYSDCTKTGLLVNYVKFLPTTN